jgi:endoglucanase
MLLILASREEKNSAMLNAALSQFDYILGKNAHNISFITGIGARHVMNPHHRPSASDGIAEPIPGLLAGGPEQNRSDPVLQAKFSASTPPAMIYTDDVGSYASNEIAINWNAPLVFVAGYFASEGTASAVGEYRDINPKGFRLDQNYPNPFNPSTTISFTLPGRNVISIDVFDTAGRTISTIIDADMPSGFHTVAFDARALSSGVYLYRLTATDGRSVFSDSKRFMLIK